MSTAIVISDLVKSFPALGGSGGQGVTVAVDRVNLAIEPGELFFLLGPSGCGKTTLLRMIAGFTEPTSGSILFRTAAGERDVTFLAPEKRNTGMVFQSYALWPHMTVAENVGFGLSVRKVAAAEKARRVAEALEAVRMGHLAARKPNQLSGGQQQRVALARALVIRPDVLLLDEPLSNLDAKLRIELRSEIRRICKSSGITTVYVTHDQKEALSMADRMAILDKGSVVQLGTPGELYRAPGSRFVAEFLGETNLLDGSVISADAGSMRIRTAAGELTSSTQRRHAAGAKVSVSLRPEALRLVRAGSPAAPSAAVNRMPARLVESVYLGEIAQHVAELPGGSRAAVAELNPRSLESSTREVHIEVDPADVVVIPS